MWELFFCQPLLWNRYRNIWTELLTVNGSNSDRPIFLVPKPLPLLVMDTSALQVFDQFTLFGRGFDQFIKFRLQQVCSSEDSADLSHF
jgi:hypothetical protein